MTRNYDIYGSRNVSSPTKTLLGLTSAATIRPCVYEILVGSTAVPADNALEFLLQRYTTAGSATAVLGVAHDPSDPAAIATGAVNHTVEPTYTPGRVLLDLAMNQRATQRWMATPGREIKLPATAANGVGLQPVHSSFVGSVTGTIFWED